MKNRCRFIFLLLVLWGCLCAVNLFRFTVLEREEHLKISAALSERTGILPAPRGRILGSDGRVLAETELQWYLHAGPEIYRHPGVLKALQEKYGALPVRIALPDEQSLRDIFRLADRGILRLERRCVRRSHAPELTGACGTDQKGVLYGMSGVEKEQENLLAGRPGRFRASVNRLGCWMHGTMVILEDPVPGQDVKLTAEQEGRAHHDAKP